MYVCVTHIYMRGDVARPIMVSTVKIEQTGGERCVWGCLRAFVRIKSRQGSARIVGGGGAK